MANGSVMFFFGAGAEASFDMPCGNQFTRILLQSQKDLELQRVYQDNINASSLVRSNSVTVYAQTIVEGQSYLEEDMVKPYQISKCKLLQFAKAILNHNDTLSEDEKNEWNAFLATLKQNIANRLQKTHTDASGEPRDLVWFVLKYAKFCESLDAKFNALRLSGENAPNSKAQRVINAYCNIHYSLAKSMSRGREETAKKSWENGEEFFEFLKKSFSVPQFDLAKDNYYDIISRLTKDRTCYYATTNYTPYSEFFFGKGRVVFLNGKMTWFENYQTLHISDIETEDYRALLSNEKKIISGVFPFIFIQSGVKPIVAPTQIEQYHKFICNLNRCETLVVLGYNFNNDDNHINATIVEWLRNDENHQITIFQFHEQLDDPAEKLTGPWEAYEKQIHIIRLSKNFACKYERNVEAISFETALQNYVL